MKRSFLIGLLILLFLTDMAQAGGGLSLSVSLTIPAIPGLNVPLIEEETLKTGGNTAREEKVESQKETTEQPPQTIQEDTPNGQSTDGEQNTLVMVKTFYSR